MSFVGVFETESIEEIEELVKKALDAMKTKAHLGKTVAICLLFPNVKPEDCEIKIDQTQRKLKSSFVKSGFMLGEFHEKNQTHGLHSQTLYPLKSPVPALVVRKIIVGDLQFMVNSQYDKNEKISLLKSYLENAPIKREIKNHDETYLKAKAMLADLQMPESRVKQISSKNQITDE